MIVILTVKDCSVGKQNLSLLYTVNNSDRSNGNFHVVLL